MPIAVIDFEATGLVPGRTDRGVEVGVALTDEDGRIEHEWTTLVNPHRDLEATHIHGIAASDVVDAPSFAEISDYVLEMLSGRVLVTHNASFDMRFSMLDSNGRGTGPEPPHRSASVAAFERIFAQYQAHR